MSEEAVSKVLIIGTGGMQLKLVINVAPPLSGGALRTPARKQMWTIRTLTTTNRMTPQ
jgi:hypothetical protein